MHPKSSKTEAVPWENVMWNELSQMSNQNPQNPQKNFQRYSK